MLLECTELPPYADALRYSTGLPVYDAITCADMFVDWCAPLAAIPYGIMIVTHWIYRATFPVVRIRSTHHHSPCPLYMLRFPTAWSWTDGC